ncbi:metal-dependent transcriptional regulator [Arcanobacterium hippocoleae]|uniref:metal-dependent transcriptional regulator n=1 Tax=Arcanobacterium hippocoleae TaxID=149017 RepID=UPI0033402FB9
MRARIVERLGQSGPTVSETVARLERDGLFVMPDGKHIEFTERGRELAADVMRRHRVSERLLQDVLGMPLPQVHAEACRWEHALSDDVAKRIYEHLGRPESDPFGNPIPLHGTADADPAAVSESGLIALSEVPLTDGEPQAVQVARFAEVLQFDAEQIELFESVGMLPGADIILRGMVADELLVDIDARQGVGKLAKMFPVSESKNLACRFLWLRKFSCMRRKLIN